STVGMAMTHSLVLRSAAKEWFQGPVVTLETAVGHARVGRHGVGWEGVRTRQAQACKDEQRAQRAPGRLNRVCSALTQLLNIFLVNDINIQAAPPAKNKRSTAVSRVIANTGVKSTEVAPFV
ncbi:hypothetical protein, partial [Staphylococcus sp. J]|uniref:hypothetical protein n=1 Tax=Staphylococcus sp. J TaxID=2502244 RepID=UPI001BB1778C